MMNEVFSKKAIQNIVKVNEHICKHRGEEHGVDDKDLLELIFNDVNSHNDIENKKARIIEKASYLLGGIIYEQPFKNGNKATADAITDYFLRNNGYELPIRTEEESNALIQLELEISPLHTMDGQKHTIFPKLRKFLCLKIVELKTEN
ncbi:Fic family protein [Nitrosopumilus sp.]|uniref:Fic family protein n=1 Tax=Nitrosopumilus sp. TaxID=2024843 RepID=UPI003B59B95E